MLPSIAIIPFDVSIFPNAADVTQLCLCTYLFLRVRTCTHRRSGLAVLSRSVACYQGPGAFQWEVTLRDPDLGIRWAHCCGRAHVSGTLSGASADTDVLGKYVKAYTQGYSQKHRLSFKIVSISPNVHQWSTG